MTAKMNQSDELIGDRVRFPLAVHLFTMCAHTLSHTITHTYTYTQIDTAVHRDHPSLILGAVISLHLVSFDTYFDSNVFPSFLNSKPKYIFLKCGVNLSLAGEGMGGAVI